jgi:hypothetical protein
MTQNLARQARDTVATFLGRDVTQEAFAYFVNSAVGTVRGWEQSRRIPCGTATHTLLSLIVQSPESMVPAIVQVHLSERLRFEVSFDLASEFVNLVLRGRGTEQDRRRACLRVLLKMFRAKKKAHEGSCEIINGMRCRVVTITPSTIVIR